jgi:hypothetical protein
MLRGFFGRILELSWAYIFALAQAPVAQAMATGEDNRGRHKRRTAMEK